MEVRTVRRMRAMILSSRQREAKLLAEIERLKAEIERLKEALRGTL